MSLIKRLREERGLTQSDLAKLAGTSQPQINRLEAGERQLSKDWAERLAPHLDISPAELMFGRDSTALSTGRSLSDHNRPNATLGSLLPEATGNLPVYGQAVGGDDGEFVLNGEKLEDVFRPPSLSSVVGAYAVYVNGSSMEPRYFDGEIVYVNPVKRVRRGDFVVAQISGEEGDSLRAYVKQFVRWNQEELVLAQYNPEKELTFPTSSVVSVHLAVMGGTV